MKDLKAYWKKVRQLEASFKQSHPAGVYLSTIAQDNGLPSGLIKLALPLVAAEAIVNGQAEVATPEQIEAYKAEQALEARRISAFENRMHGSPVTVVQMTPDGAVFTERHLDVELKRI